MKHTAMIILVCLLSCKAQKKEQLVAGEKSSDMVLIAEDAFSGITEFEAMVIGDAKSLNKFYSQINKTRKPGLPIPIVDFSRDMVVVVCMGAQRGEVIPVVSKYDGNEDKTLITIELPNGKDQVKVENLPVSSPFYVYKMPNTSKTVNFQKLGW